MNTHDLYGRSPIRENRRHTHHAHGINLQAAAGMHSKRNVVAQAQEIQHGAFQHQTPRKHTLPKSAVCTVPYTCTQPITPATVATRTQN